MVVSPLMNALAKRLQGDDADGQVVWARHMFRLLTRQPVVRVRFGAKVLWPERIGEKVPRGGLVLTAAVPSLAATARIPPAHALSLFVTSPRMVTPSASLGLPKPVGPRRMAVVAVGSSVSWRWSGRGGHLPPLMARPNFDN